MGSTKYTAASGSQVVNTGTNFWGRGLALDTDGQGEPDLRIQQATTNILLDMGATPTTPHTGITCRPPGRRPSCRRSRPTPATSAGRTQPVTATFTPRDGPDVDHGVDAHPDRPGRRVRPGDGDVRRGLEDRVDDAAEPAGDARRLHRAAHHRRQGDPTARRSQRRTSGRSAPGVPVHVYGTATPAQTGLDIQDGRWGGGPYTLELGAKYVADLTMTLTGLRFYKSPGETGTHAGKVWNDAGSLIASVTFTNESASGWQTQSPAHRAQRCRRARPTCCRSTRTALRVQAAGLQTARTPESCARSSAANGVYALTAADFPSNTTTPATTSSTCSSSPTATRCRWACLDVAGAGQPGRALSTTVTAAFTRDVRPRRSTGRRSR